MKKFFFAGCLLFYCSISVFSDPITSRFRVENDYGTPIINPAYLGAIDTGRFYLTVGIPIQPSSTTDSGSGSQYVDWTKSVDDTTGGWTLGYMMPIGRRWGISIEFDFGSFGKGLWSSTPFDYEGTPYVVMFGSPNLFGGSLGLGWRFVESMSVGLSSTVWYTDKNAQDSDHFMYEDGIGYSGQLGFGFYGYQDRLRADIGITYINLPARYVDFDTMIVQEEYTPSLVEASITYSLPEFPLILSFLSVADVYLGLYDTRSGHGLRLVPAVEYRVAPSLSLRTGFEYSHLMLDQEFTAGYGVLMGFTVEFWEMQIELNSTCRRKPTDMLSGAATFEYSFLISAIYYPSFLDR